MLLPALALFITFICYPMFYGFFISLNRWDGFSDMKFVGFQNYLGIFKDQLFYNSFLHNVIFALGSVFGKVVLALLIAILLNRRFKGVTFFRGVFFTPVVISFVAIGLLWQRLYDPNLGLIEQFLASLKLIKEPVGWLADPKIALWAVILVDIWKWTGYHTVLYLAGLQTIAKELYESAEIDGANAWQQLWYITLPELRPVTIINVTIATMGAFSVFDLVFMLTNGGPFNSTHVMLTYMYQITFGGSDSNFGYGSAVAYIVLAIIFAISLVQSKIMTQDEV